MRSTLIWRKIESNVSKYDDDDDEDDSTVIEIVVVGGTVYSPFHTISHLLSVFIECWQFSKCHFPFKSSLNELSSSFHSLN